MEGHDVRKIVHGEGQKGTTGGMHSRNEKIRCRSSSVRCLIRRLGGNVLKTGARRAL